MEAGILAGRPGSCGGVVMARVAPHFQQTDNVGGLPLPQLGQMGLGGAACKCECLSSWFWNGLVPPRGKSLQSWQIRRFR